MERYTLKELKRLISTGAAKDITFSNTRSDVPELYTQSGIPAASTAVTACCCKAKAAVYMP